MELPVRRTAAGGSRRRSPSQFPARRARRSRATRAPTSSILGGGYTGMWTAWFLKERDPGLDVVLLEQDICGGGPSGRNGGFCNGLWEEAELLVEELGEERRARTAARRRALRRRDRRVVRRPTTSTRGSRRPGTSACRPRRRRTARGARTRRRRPRVSAPDWFVELSAGRGPRAVRLAGVPRGRADAPRRDGPAGPPGARAPPACCSSAVCGVFEGSPVPRFRGGSAGRGRDAERTRAGRRAACSGWARTRRR